MRLILLTLTALFFVGSARADVEITLTDLGGGKIAIGYDATGEAELVRAFALDITATDGNIIDINDYAVGDDNAGFGIFPGSFAAAPVVVNPATGEVDNWAVPGYTLVAPAGDPDALGAIPGPAITIEMGSLYDTAPPGSTGTLCVITVDENVTQLCVTGNAIRGNIVLEDASEATMTPAEVCWIICADCGRCGCLPDGHPDCEEFAAVGKPACWCLPYQCDGDANDDTQVIGWRVYTNDLVRLANNWQKKIGDPGFDPCADFDHAGQVIGWRTYTNDLVILANNWQKRDHQLPGDCSRPE